jgi:predicted aspartyl protease
VAVFHRVIGHVDLRGRPLVRLEAQNGESFLGLVDTGFNGDLHMTALVARRLGFGSSGLIVDAEVAGGVLQKVEVGSATIPWLGRSRSVELLLAGEPSRPQAPDDPVALVGTRLLTPHVLLIDFLRSTVELEEQEA